MGRLTMLMRGLYLSCWTHGGGSVDVTEFVDGCIRLKGQAKSIQMAQLMYHHKWIMDKLVELSETVHTQGKYFSHFSSNQKIIIAHLVPSDPVTQASSA